MRDTLVELTLERPSMITDAGLSTIALFTHLKGLVIDSCELISDEGVITLLGSLPQTLEYLSVDNCSTLTDEIMVVLAACFPTLQSLSLDSCEIGDPGLVHLSSAVFCKSLKSLNLCYINATGLGITACLTAFTALEHINLDLLADVGDDPLQYLPSALVSFSAEATDIGNEGIQHLVHLCPKLHTLSLLCNQLTDFGVQLLEGLPSLQVLALSVPTISPECLSHLPEGLKVLKLAGCLQGVNDNSLMTVCQKQKSSLLSLDIKGCILVTAAGFLSALPVCCMLRHVNAEQCPAINRQVTEQLKATCPSLVCFCSTGTSTDPEEEWTELQPCSMERDPDNAISYW
ncbi:hypothetical protein Pelo_3425 [Pelomyxa schiedti]|nr:hypothetical protein Pelo_3425 [Pelomyxa schiedti]